MAISRMRPLRKLITVVVAAVTAVLAVLSLAESADAAYAPTGGLTSFSPVRCHSDTVAVANFPKNKPFAVYTENKGKIVTFKRTKTNAAGAVRVKFTVGCSITVGTHRLGLASGKTKVKLMIHVKA